MSLFPADIGDSFQKLGDTVFEWIPRLIGALVILLIAYIVAKVVRTILTRVLTNVGLDRSVRSGQSGAYVERFASGFSPTRAIAGLAFWFIFLTGVMLAASALGIAALTAFIAAIVAYLPNVIAAILILVVAIAISAAVGGVVAKLMGDTAVGKIAASVVPVLVMTVAVFMALVQLRIAVPIVTGTYYILLGSIALGAALAFGLGGRDAAGRLLDGAYERGQAAAPQVREEMALAKDRAQERLDQAKGKVEEERAKTEGGGAGPDTALPDGERYVPRG